MKSYNISNFMLTKGMLKPSLSQNSFVVSFNAINSIAYLENGNRVVFAIKAYRKGLDMKLF